MVKDGRQGRAQDILHTAFGLTPAEARIALGIARGETLGMIADMHGIAVATARKQLKSVFTKTRTHRQAQLAALLAGLGEAFRSYSMPK